MQRYCTKGGFHEDNLLNMVCIDSQCPNSGQLICCECLAEEHNRHESVSLKKFILLSQQAVSKAKQNLNAENDLNTNKNPLDSEYFELFQQVDAHKIAIQQYLNLMRDNFTQFKEKVENRCQNIHEQLHQMLQNTGNNQENEQLIKQMEQELEKIVDEENVFNANNAIKRVMKDIQVSKDGSTLKMSQNQPNDNFTDKHARNRKKIMIENEFKLIKDSLITKQTELLSFFKTFADTIHSNIHRISKDKQHQERFQNLYQSHHQPNGKHQIQNNSGNTSTNKSSSNNNTNGFQYSSQLQGNQDLKPVDNHSPLNNQKMNTPQKGFLTTSSDKSSKSKMSSSQKKDLRKLRKLQKYEKKKQKRLIEQQIELQQLKNKQLEMENQELAKQQKNQQSLTITKQQQNVFQFLLPKYMKNGEQQEIDQEDEQNFPVDYPEQYAIEEQGQENQCQPEDFHMNNKRKAIMGYDQDSIQQQEDEEEEIQDDYQMEQYDDQHEEPEMEQYEQEEEEEIQNNQEDFQENEQPEPYNNQLVLQNNNNNKNLEQQQYFSDEISPHTRKMMKKKIQREKFQKNLATVFSDEKTSQFQQQHYHNNFPYNDENINTVNIMNDQFKVRRKSRKQVQIQEFQNESSGFKEQIIRYAQTQQQQILSKNHQPSYLQNADVILQKVQQLKHYQKLLEQEEGKTDNINNLNSANPHLSSREICMKPAKNSYNSRPALAPIKQYTKKSYLYNNITNKQQQHYQQEQYDIYQQKDQQQPSQYDQDSIQSITIQDSDQEEQIVQQQQIQVQQQQQEEEDQEYDIEQDYYQQPQQENSFEQFQQLKQGLEYSKENEQNQDLNNNNENLQQNEEQGEQDQNQSVESGEIEQDQQEEQINNIVNDSIMEQQGVQELPEIIED